MMRTSLNFFIFSLLSVFMLTACQKNQPHSSGLIGEALMADRPSMPSGRQVFLVELKEDALVTTAQKNAQGVLELNADHKARVEKEQAELDSKLSEISLEIKVLFRYKYILNAVAVVAPVELQSSIEKLPLVKQVKQRQIFQKPEPQVKLAALTSALMDLTHNSVTHIEAGAAYDQGIRGQGIRVGILDTGIDFTHSMLGGSGKVEDYKSVDPNRASTFFPNKKVVGGIDLAGTKYDASSLDPEKRIPRPDQNPMDEGGHGSHVAGTVAGIGDNVNSYDGVAPDALLYAIKVFGAGGSTSDEVVIAGLEWALDPNQDGNLDDQLHVVNLSLGGGNGTPYDLYNKAVTQLTRAGTVMVASAGNSSDIPFIVGSPSTSDEALSVAAQIDSSPHNWRFKTIGFYLGEAKLAVAEAIEGAKSKPIQEVGDLKGSVVFAGIADKDYTDEEAAMIKGKVALIDRGVVTFEEKMVRAQKAGAIGVIVAQNRPDAPFTMGGGEISIEIPAVMISQDVRNKIVAELEKNQDVVVAFQNPELIEKPELVGVITDFSSRGPRSGDLAIKPEITAPGQNIISAALGEGNKAVQMSGTSMSGPHMAGVMALMKQKFANLSTRELKSVVMSTSVPVKTAEGVIDSVARQGAGQVLVSRALNARFVSDPAALSLGLQLVEGEKRISRSLRLKSLGDDDQSIEINLETSSASVSVEKQNVVVKPQGLTDVKLQWTLKASRMAAQDEEVTGWVILKSGEWTQRIPFLVHLQKISNIKLTQVKNGSSSAADAEGSDVSLEFTNRGPHLGSVWAFNLIGQDGQKKESDSQFISSECDIKVAGYRIHENQLQVAVKLYRRVSTWPLCEVSVLLDQDGDGKPEAELALTTGERIPGLSGTDLVSTLLDFKAAQKIRDETEAKAKASDKKVALDLSKAVLAQMDAVAEDLSSAVLIKMDLQSLKSIVGSRPSIQVVASANEKNVESDDFLKNSKHWTALSLNPQDQAWIGLSNWTLQGGQTQKVDLVRGASSKPLLLIYPQNSLDSRGLTDSQLEIYRPKYTESVGVLKN